MTAASSNCGAAPAGDRDAAGSSADLAAAASGPARPTRLRQLLVGLDLLAATLAWAAAAWVGGSGGSRRSALPLLLAVPMLVLLTLVTANARRLYRAQVCSIRAVEMQRMGQVVLLTGAAAALVGPRIGLSLPADEVLVGSVLTFILTTTFRGGYRSWLATGRRHGRFQRRVVIVGTSDEARDLFELVTDHPELGLGVVGVVGDPLAGGTSGPPLLGPLSRTEQLVRASGATGVLIGATALGPDELNRVTRNLLQAGVHIHLASGLRGFAAHRLRPQLLSNESVLYLEPLRMARWQLAVKRALDITLATLGLVLSIPVVAAAALAIKLHDGGPVLFRQTRVGRGGRHFTILKLRTMVPDAEARYQALAVTLAGRDGPLVKLHSDPRITRVGRVLRATSIDELPQLVNVIRGSMSLVGPRPNLLVEAEGLDPAFLAHKCQVRPGLSGLWQVEARDDPSYSIYRRLDVFYLENWSIGLDLAILLVTVQRVAGRGLRLLAGRSGRAAPALMGEAAGSP